MLALSANWTLGKILHAQLQFPGQCFRRQTEAGSIIQLVRQRLDQQEETKKGCSAGSDIKSVVHKLCEVKNCSKFYSENTMELSVQV